VKQKLLTFVVDY